MIHTYYGCNITRNTNPAGLPWSAYCAGQFISADTLAGIKALIRDTLKHA